MSTIRSAILIILFPFVGFASFVVHPGIKKEEKITFLLEKVSLVFYNEI
jgi:hypothetical protein